MIIAFEGSDGRELIKNTWSMGKGEGLWDVPYPLYEGGCSVHSFFRNMWHRMRSEVFRVIWKGVREDEG